MRASVLSWCRTVLVLLTGFACAAAPAARTHEAGYRAVDDDVDTGLAAARTRDDRDVTLRQTDLALLDVSLPAVPAALTTSEPEAQDEEEWLVDIVVNGQPVQGTWLLRRAASGWMLDAKLLPAAGMRPLDAREWITLDELVGDGFVFDRAALRLELSVAVDRFAGIDLSLAENEIPAIERQLSTMLRYDVASGIDDDGRGWSSSLFDARVSRGDISCRSVQAWRSRTARLDRLETACIYDWPDRLQSIRVGDSITRSGAFGQTVRYGGVRLGTDYDLAPYLQTLPTLSVDGSARMPSLLEVFIDQRLALRTEVPAGPFDIRDIPTTTGNGEVRTVVTDALGRQSIISSPFYSDPLLLRPGLLDWSAEVGRVRTGFFGPDRYGDGFAALSARRGMSDALTLEVRAEARDDAAMLGVTATARLGALGVAELGVSESRDAGKSGRAFLLGYSFRAHDWSVGLRRWRSDADYRALGYETAGAAPEDFSQVHLGLRLARASLSFAAVVRDRRDVARDRFASGSLSLPLWRGSLLSLNVMHGLEDEGDTTYGLTWSMPLGSARSAYAAVQQQPGEGSLLQTGLQRSPPPGAGYGYRLQTSHGEDIDAWFAQGAHRSEFGELELAASSNNGSRQGNARWSGSVIANRDGVFAARSDPGAYASVNVGAPGVRVYRDQQPVAVSRADGIALVPGLRPFERNRLQASTQDLPMNRQILSNEITLVPGRDQALAAQFELREPFWISAQLRLADGSLVPPGTELSLGSDGASLGRVGFDGLVFIELPARVASRIDARWASNHCIFELDAGDLNADPQEELVMTCVSP